MIRDGIEEDHVPEEDPLYEEDLEGNDNILDDDYIVQLHKYLQEKKMQRIQAEKDANLLDCRLRCLKEQEENTLKKIEVKRKQTTQKKKELQTQEEELRKKMEFMRKKEIELEKKREQNKLFKESNRAAVNLKKEENRRKIEEDMKNMKEQKKTNEYLRNYYMIEALTNKKTQADYIKSQHNIAEEKRKAIELEKKSRIKEELEKRILEETLKIQEAEQKKQNLEEKEIEVMNTLKTTTQIQLTQSGVKNRKFYINNNNME